MMEESHIKNNNTIEGDPKGSPSIDKISDKEILKRQDISMKQLLENAEYTTLVTFSAENGREMKPNEVVAEFKKNKKKYNKYIDSLHAKPKVPDARRPQNDSKPKKERKPQNVKQRKPQNPPKVKPAQVKNDRPYNVNGYNKTASFGGKEKGEYCWLICSDFIKSLVYMTEEGHEKVMWDSDEKRFKIASKEDRDSSQIIKGRSFKAKQSRKLHTETYDGLSNPFTHDTRYRVVNFSFNRWSSQMKEIVRLCDEKNYSAYCKGEQRTEGLSPAVNRNVPKTVSRMSTVEEIIYKIDLLPDDTPMVAWTLIEENDKDSIFHFDPRKGFRCVGEFKAIFKYNYDVVYLKNNDLKDPLSFDKRSGFIKQELAGKMIMWNKDVLYSYVLHNERLSIDSGYFSDCDEVIAKKMNIYFGGITTIKKTLFDDLDISNKSKFIQQVSAHDTMMINKYFSRNPFDVVITAETSDGFSSQLASEDNSTVFVERPELYGNGDYWAHLDILVHDIFRLVGSNCSTDEILAARLKDSEWYTIGNKYHITMSTDNLLTDRLNIVIQPTKTTTLDNNTDKYNMIHDIGTVLLGDRIYSCPMGTSMVYPHGHDLTLGSYIVDGTVQTVHDTSGHEVWTAFFLSANKYDFEKVVMVSESRTFAIPYFTNTWSNNLAPLEPKLVEHHINKQLLNDMIGKNMTGKLGYKAMVSYGMSLIWMKYTKRGDVFRDVTFTEKQIKVHAYIAQILVGRYNCMREFSNLIATDRPYKIAMATASAVVSTLLPDEKEQPKILIDRVKNEIGQYQKYWNDLELWLNIDSSLVRVTSNASCAHHDSCDGTLTKRLCICCRHMTAGKSGYCEHCKDNGMLSCGHTQFIDTTGDKSCKCCRRPSTRDLCTNCADSDGTLRDVQHLMEYKFDKSDRGGKTDTTTRTTVATTTTSSEHKPEKPQPKSTEPNTTPQPSIPIHDSLDWDLLMDQLSNCVDEVSYRQIKSKFTDMSVPMTNSSLSHVTGVASGSNFLELDSIDHKKIDNNYEKYCGVKCLLDAYKMEWIEELAIKFSTAAESNVTQLILLATHLRVNVIVVNGAVVKSYKLLTTNEFAVIVHARNYGETGDHWYLANCTRTSKAEDEFMPCDGATATQYEVCSRRMYNATYSALPLEQKVKVMIDIAHDNVVKLKHVRTIPTFTNGVLTNNKHKQMNWATGEVHIDLSKFSDVANELETSMNAKSLTDAMLADFDYTKKNVFDMPYYMAGKLREHGTNMFNILNKMCNKRTYVMPITLGPNWHINIDVSNTKLKTGDVVYLGNSMEPYFCVVHNGYMSIRYQSNPNFATIQMHVPVVSFGSALRGILALCTRQPRLDIENLLKTSTVVVRPGGGGKTTWLAKKIAEYTQEKKEKWTVIAGTRGGVDSASIKLPPHVDVFSVERALQSNTEYTNLAIDEASLLRVGDVGMLTQGTKQLLLLCDPTQIGVKDMVAISGTRDELSVVDYAGKNETSMRTFRYGGEVVKALQGFKELKDLIADPVAPDSKLFLHAYAHLKDNEFLQLCRDVNVILFFYNDHLAWAREVIRKAGFNKLIELHTVHGFQGQERDNVMVYQAKLGTADIHLQTGYIISAATRCKLSLTWVSVGCFLTNPPLHERCMRLAGMDERRPDRPRGVRNPFGFVLRHVRNESLPSFLRNEGYDVSQYRLDNDPQREGSNSTIDLTDQANITNAMGRDSQQFMDSPTEEIDHSSLSLDADEPINKVDKLISQAIEGHSVGPFQYHLLDVGVLKTLMLYKFEGVASNLVIVKHDGLVTMTGEKWRMQFKFSYNGETFSTNIPGKYGMTLKCLCDNISNIDFDVSTIKELTQYIEQSQYQIVRNKRMNTMLRNLAHLVKIYSSFESSMNLSGKRCAYKVTAGSGCSACCAVIISDGVDYLNVGPDYHCWGSRPVSTPENSTLFADWFTEPYNYDPAETYGLDITIEEYSICFLSERIRTALVDATRVRTRPLMHFEANNNSLRSVKMKQVSDLIEPFDKFSNTTNWPGAGTTWHYSLTSVLKGKMSSDVYHIVTKDYKLMEFSSRTEFMNEWMKQVLIAFHSDVVDSMSLGIYRLAAYSYIKYAGAKVDYGMSSLFRPLEWHRTHKTSTYETWADKMLASELQQLSKSKKSIYLGGKAREHYALYTQTMRVDTLNNSRCMDAQLEACCMYLYTLMRSHSKHVTMCCDVANIAYNYDEMGCIIAPVRKTLTWELTKSNLMFQVEQQMLRMESDKLKAHKSSQNVFCNDVTRFRQDVCYYGPNFFQLTDEEILSIMKCKNEITWIMPNIKLNESSTTLTFFEGSYALTISEKFYDAIFKHGLLMLEGESFTVHTLKVKADIRICRLVRGMKMWIDPLTDDAVDIEVSLPDLNLELTDILASKSILRKTSFRLIPRLYNTLARRMLRPGTTYEDLLVQGRVLFHSEIFTTKRREKSYKVTAAAMLNHVRYAYITDLVETNNLVLMRYYSNEDDEEVREPVLTFIKNVLKTVGVGAVSVIEELLTDALNFNVLDPSKLVGLIERQDIRAFAEEFIKFAEMMRVNRDRKERNVRGKARVLSGAAAITKLGLRFVYESIKSFCNRIVQGKWLGIKLSDSVGSLPPNSFYMDNGCKSSQVDLIHVEMCVHILNKIQFIAKRKMTLCVGARTLEVAVFAMTLDCEHYIGFTYDQTPVIGTQYSDYQSVCMIDQYLFLDDDLLYHTFMKLEDGILVPAGETLNYTYSGDGECYLCKRPSLSGLGNCVEHLHTITEEPKLYKSKQYKYTFCMCGMYEMMPAICKHCGYSRNGQRGAVNFSPIYANTVDTAAHHKSSFRFYNDEEHDDNMLTYGKVDDCELCQSYETRNKEPTTDIPESYEKPDDNTETDEKDSNSKPRNDSNYFKDVKENSIQDDQPSVQRSMSNYKMDNLDFKDSIDYSKFATGELNVKDVFNYAISRGYECRHIGLKFPIKSINRDLTLSDFEKMSLEMKLNTYMCVEYGIRGWLTATDCCTRTEWFMVIGASENYVAQFSPRSLRMGPHGICILSRKCMLTQPTIGFYRDLIVACRHSMSLPTHWHGWMAHETVTRTHLSSYVLPAGCRVKNSVTTESNIDNLVSISMSSINSDVYGQSDLQMRVNKEKYDGCRRCGNSKSVYDSKCRACDIVNNLERCEKVESLELCNYNANPLGDTYVHSLDDLKDVCHEKGNFTICIPADHGKGFVSMMLNKLGLSDEINESSMNWSTPERPKGRVVISTHRPKADDEEYFEVVNARPKHVGWLQKDEEQFYCERQSRWCELNTNRGVYIKKNKIMCYGLAPLLQTVLVLVNGTTINKVTHECHSCEEHTVLSLDEYLEEDAACKCGVTYMSPDVVLQDGKIYEKKRLIRKGTTLHTLTHVNTDEVNPESIPPTPGTIDMTIILLVETEYELRQERKSDNVTVNCAVTQLLGILDLQNPIYKELKARANDMEVVRMPGIIQIKSAYLLRDGTFKFGSKVDFVALVLLLCQTLVLGQNNYKYKDSIKEIGQPDVALVKNESGLIIDVELITTLRATNEYRHTLTTSMSELCIFQCQLDDFDKVLQLKLTKDWVVWLCENETDRAVRITLNKPSTGKLSLTVLEFYSKRDLIRHWLFEETTSELCKTHKMHKTCIGCSLYRFKIIAEIDERHAQLDELFGVDMELMVNLSERQRAIFSELAKFNNLRLPVKKRERDLSDRQCAQHFLPRKMLEPVKLMNDEMIELKSMCAQINELEFKNGGRYLVTAMSEGMDRSPYLMCDGNVCVSNAPVKGYETLIASSEGRALAGYRLLPYLLSDAVAKFVHAGGRSALHGRYGEEVVMTSEHGNCSITCIGPGFLMDACALTTKPSVEDTAKILSILCAYRSVYGIDEAICELLPSMVLYNNVDSNMPYVATDFSIPLKTWTNNQTIEELTKLVSGPVYSLRLDVAELTALSKYSSDDAMKTLDDRYIVQGASKLGQIDSSRVMPMLKYTAEKVKDNQNSLRNTRELIAELPHMLKITVTLLPEHIIYNPEGPSDCILKSIVHSLGSQGITVDMEEARRQYGFESIMTLDNAIELILLMGYNVLTVTNGYLSIKKQSAANFVCLIEQQGSQINHVCAGDHNKLLAIAHDRNTTLTTQPKLVKDTVHVTWEAKRIQDRVNALGHVQGRGMHPVKSIAVWLDDGRIYTQMDARLSEGWYIIATSAGRFVVQLCKLGDKNELKFQTSVTLHWFGNALTQMGLHSEIDKKKKPVVNLLRSGVTRYAINNATFKYMRDKHPEIPVSLQPSKNIVVIHYDGNMHHNNSEFEAVRGTDAFNIMLRPDEPVSIREIELLTKFAYGPIVCTVEGGRLRLGTAVTEPSMKSALSAMYRLNLVIMSDTVGVIEDLLKLGLKLGMVLKGNRWAPEHEIEPGNYDFTKIKMTNMFKDKRMKAVINLMAKNDNIKNFRVDYVNTDEALAFGTSLVHECESFAISRGVYCIPGLGCIIEPSYRGGAKQSELAANSIFEMAEENDYVFGVHKSLQQPKITTLTEQQKTAVMNLGLYDANVTDESSTHASVAIYGKRDNNPMRLNEHVAIWTDFDVDNLEPMHPATTINYVDDHGALLQTEFPLPNIDVKMRIRGSAHEIRDQTKFSNVKYPGVAAASYTKTYRSLEAATSDLYGNVQKLAKVELNIEEELSRVAEEAYIDGWQDVVKGYRESPLGYNAKDILEWLKERPGNSAVCNELITILEDGYEVNPINKLNIHAKIESRVKDLMMDDEHGGLLDRDDTGVYRNRLIVWQAKGITALFAPVFLEAKKRIKALLDSRILYTDGMTPQQLAARLRNIDADNVWFLEDDLKKQDRQTDRRLIEIEMAWYTKHLGVAESVIELWKIAHEKWTAKNPMIRVKMDGMRQTGQATTAIGNFFINLLIKTNLLKQNRGLIVLMILLGDDNLIISRVKISAKDNMKMCRIKYNMIAESVDSQTQGGFLRMIVFRNPAGYLDMGPDVIRLRRKFEMPNGVSEMTPENSIARIRSYCHVFGDIGPIVKVAETHDIKDIPKCWYEPTCLFDAVANKYKTTRENVETELARLCKTMMENKSYELRKPAFVEAKHYG